MSMNIHPPTCSKVIYQNRHYRPIEKHPLLCTNDLNTMLNAAIHPLTARIKESNIVDLATIRTFSHMLFVISLFVVLRLVVI